MLVIFPRRMLTPPATNSRTLQTRVMLVFTERSDPDEHVCVLMLWTHINDLCKTLVS